jgi:phosphomannomutase/phosphoglucomutase
MYDEVAKIGEVYMYKTGHSNIKVKMKELNIHIAAEVSGHLFFADRYYGYDDAIYAMLRTLELVYNGMDLDIELEKLPRTYATEELKIPTTEEAKFATIEKLRTFLQNPPAGFPKIRDIITVDGVRVVFEKGWGLIRASNTTPVLVARFEATDEEAKRSYQEAMEAALETCQKG